MYMNLHFTSQVPPFSLSLEEECGEETQKLLYKRELKLKMEGYVESFSNSCFCCNPKLFFQLKKKKGTPTVGRYGHAGTTWMCFLLTDV